MPALIHLSASLSVRGCGLKRLPANIKYLRNLHHLSLEDNSISRFPFLVSLLRQSSVAVDGPELIALQLFDMKLLRSVNLANNQIEKLAVEKILRQSQIVRSPGASCCVVGGPG